MTSTGVPAGQIHSSLAELITTYEHQTEIGRNHILDFHVRFEEIFPFEEGNGRMGRLIMFKECLRHDIMPFIIGDDADTVLGMLCSTYYELNCNQDTDEVKQY